MKVFEYVILAHPTEKEAEEGKTSEIIVGIKAVLAPSEQGAAMLAGRDIPDEWISKIDRVEVAVRAF